MYRLFVFAMIALFGMSCGQEGATNADDWTLGPFVKVDSVNPVLETDMAATFACPMEEKDVQWSDRFVYNPAVVVRNGKVYLLYRAQGKRSLTSRLGLAQSDDGLHFRHLPEPVFYPTKEMEQYEWPGGVEDPRIVEDERGTYFMTYTAYDGKTARLMVASSESLYSWQKHGPAFGEAGAAYWSKSGSIVCKRKGSRWVATQIDGKYWMYWGDENLYLATSTDLIRWTPVTYAPGDSTTLPYKFWPEAYQKANLKPVVGPRTGKFDSDLVEPGPPAMLTDKGILLLYNSRNVRTTGDTTLAEGCYSAGQMLFDKNDPSKLLKRTDNYFMTADRPYEINGQVNHVTFIEGLAYLRNRWFLYYGTADSRIAVAVCER